jgi:hypothetical protein
MKCAGADSRMDDLGYDVGKVVILLVILVLVVGSYFLVRWSLSVADEKKAERECSGITKLLSYNCTSMTECKKKCVSSVLNGPG